MINKIFYFRLRQICLIQKGQKLYSSGLCWKPLIGTTHLVCCLISQRASEILLTFANPKVAPSTPVSFQSSSSFLPLTWFISILFVLFFSLSLLCSFYLTPVELSTFFSFFPNCLVRFLLIFLLILVYCCYVLSVWLAEKLKFGFLYGVWLFNGQKVGGKD